MISVLWSTRGPSLRNISQADNFKAAEGITRDRRAMSAGRESEPGHGAREPDAKDVARRRDELLSEARRNAAPDAAGVPAGNAASPSALAGMGLQFVVVILLCLYAGMWLDRKFGTAPWLLIAGVLVGATAGFYSLYRVMTSANARGRK
jgi:F0F1-type ATP synthase assembly protein I